MSDGAAAHRNLVLKLGSGLRKMMVNWITEEKKNPDTAGLHVRYRAIDQALDQMDLSTADSIICPIHLQYVHPLAHTSLIKP